MPIGPKKKHVTYSQDEVRKVLTAAANDRNRHAWHLALSGLHRGEIGGLRWTGIDLDAGPLTIVNNRVSVNGKAEEYDPKSDESGRTLPLDAHPDD